MMQVKWEGMTVSVETPAIEDKIKRLIMSKARRSGVANTYKLWSQEDKDKAHSLFMAGKSPKEIGEVLGRVSLAVSSMLYREYDGLSRKTRDKVEEKEITV